MELAALHHRKTVDYRVLPSYHMINSFLIGHHIIMSMFAFLYYTMYYEICMSASWAYPWGLIWLLSIHTILLCHTCI